MAASIASQLDQLPGKVAGSESSESSVEAQGAREAARTARQLIGCLGRGSAAGGAVGVKVVLLQLGWPAQEVAAVALWRAGELRQG